MSKKTYDALRCPSCDRLVLKVERDALVAGKSIEIKCPRCANMAYFVGTAAVPKHTPSAA